MSDPGFARPDLCSIRTADEQEELAEAVRGGFSADGCPLGDDDPPAPRASGIDRAIRLSTAAAVLAVAGIAAYVSYWHAYAVVRAHGESRDHRPARAGHDRRPGLRQFDGGAVRRPAPGAGTLPGPLAARRWESPLPSRRTWPRAGPTVPSGRWSRPGRRSASWARTNFWSGSSAPPGRQNAGRRQSTCATARPAVLRRVLSRPQPLTASAPEGTSATRQTRRGGPRVRPPGSRPSPPAGSVTHEVPEASAVNDAAVAAYRLSVQAGNPLSERRLAQMFGRTSRRWARARIADAGQTAPFPDSPNTLVPAYVDGLGHSAGQALLRSVRDFARKEWPLRGSPADVRSRAILRSSGGR